MMHWATRKLTKLVAHWLWTVQLLVRWTMYSNPKTRKKTQNLLIIEEDFFLPEWYLLSCVHSPIHRRQMLDQVQTNISTSNHWVVSSAQLMTVSSIERNRSKFQVVENVQSMRPNVVLLCREQMTKPWFLLVVIVVLVRSLPI